MKIPTLKLLENMKEVVEVEVFDQLQSTNKYLLEKESDKEFCFVQALKQSAGVGRHGKVWKDDGESALFSIATEMKMEQLVGLSVVVGVSVAGVLEQFGLSVQIKWPNDVYIEGRKNCGILIELKPKAGQLWVVIGIGVNVNKAPKVDQPSISLSEVLNNTMDVQLVAQLIAKAVIGDVIAIKNGEAIMRSSIERYRKYDYLLNKEINIISANTLRVGVARGLSNDGALLVEVEGCKEEISSGEVSIRLLDC
jgi:BirA family transcriptional regulator, biotin operon repressor / biotin---[acetyl-CoA-carboxylase] ligase